MGQLRFSHTLWLLVAIGLTSATQAFAGKSEPAPSCALLSSGPAVCSAASQSYQENKKAYEQTQDGAAKQRMDEALENFKSVFQEMLYCYKTIAALSEPMTWNSITAKSQMDKDHASLVKQDAQTGNNDQVASRLQEVRAILPESEEGLRKASECSRKADAYFASVAAANPPTQSCLGFFPKDSEAEKRVPEKAEVQAHVTNVNAVEPKKHEQDKICKAAVETLPVNQQAFHESANNAERQLGVPQTKFSTAYTAPQNHPTNAKPNAAQIQRSKAFGVGLMTSTTGMADEGAKYGDLMTPKPKTPTTAKSSSRKLAEDLDNSLSYEAAKPLESTVYTVPTGDIR